MSLIDRLRRKRPTAAAAEPASARELFLSDVLRTARAGQVLIDARTDASHFAVIGTLEGRERTFFLENLFAETRDVPPQDRRQRILRFLRVPLEFDDAPWALADVDARLVPVVRAASYWNATKGAATSKTVQRPFAPFLVESVVLDSDNAMQFVTKAEATAWGVTPGQVFEAAHATLTSVARVGIETYADGPPAIWHVASGDSYESSRLLLPGWLASFADRVPGRPIAAIPHRGMLLVAGDGDPHAIERLLASAQAEYGASTRRLSPAIYTQDDGGQVIPFELPADHPCRHAVHLAHVKLAVHEYRVQKEQLEQQYDRDGTNVFVATYTARQLASGSVVSHCVWAENVDTLLPHTDLVAFAREGERSFLVPWKEVERIAGACWGPASEMEPARMRTLRWPDQQVFTLLRSAAVDLDR